MDWGEAVISKFELVPPHAGVNLVILVPKDSWDKRALMTELVRARVVNLGAAARLAAGTKAANDKTKAAAIERPATSSTAKRGAH